MAILEIPIPDFSLSDYVKKLAKNLIDNYLTEQKVESLDNYKNKYNVVENEMHTQIYRLNKLDDRLVYICEILIHLALLRTKDKFTFVQFSNLGNRPAQKVRNDNFYIAIDHFQFYSYNLLAGLGYDLDKNTFTNEDILDLCIKVNVILERLEILKAGQEVIYDNIDEVKAEFDSLKSDFPLGKKRWFQRVGGIIMSYAGDKGGEEFWVGIKPYLIELLKKSPRYIESIIKLIS